MNWVGKARYLCYVAAGDKSPGGHAWIDAPGAVQPPLSSYTSCLPRIAIVFPDKFPKPVSLITAQQFIIHSHLWQSFSPSVLQST